MVFINATSRQAGFAQVSCRFRLPFLLAEQSSQADEERNAKGGVQRKAKSAKLAGNADVALEAGDVSDVAPAVDNSINGNLTTVNAYVNKDMAKLIVDAGGTGGILMNQLKACGLTIVLSVVATVIITLIVKVIIGLRPTPEAESIGLDLADHGEAGYEH